MRIAVPAERRPGERRVAAVPDTIAPLTRDGHQVVVETGAGRGCFVSDQDYRDAGAEVVDGDVLSAADVVLHVRPLEPDVVQRLRPGAVTLGFCSPSAEPDGVRALRDGRVTAFSMELVPRISRAQSMDALTSQALVAGYRCVLEAAMRLPRFFPLFMTAAGTVPPAKVLVLGAGVAGLQAIATARRLGAVVEAYDVRPASADEVRSMGATFIQLELEAIEGVGGYAREMAEDRARRQMELLTPYVVKSDVVITTAAVPGRRAPLLVTRQMVEGMRPGSVVVDLAAESGGNVEGSVAGQDVAVGGATLVGMADASSTMPVDASRLYAKNVSNLLALMVDADGALHLNLDDEVLAGACLTHDGVVRHAPTAESLGDSPAPPADEPPPGAGPAAAHVTEGGA
ncbi:MAG TPA: Re/Si-specific NAD(P)(+) transhydrogenase subunit alpha [Actinomycetales bacterium]|nr:Re/Si-specific NAD(P)(+) transhydrogenase subunit alpha [Actinomycetales bacterium]